MIKDIMTPQEVFDHIVEHMRKQKRHAIGDGGTCCYRTTDIKGLCMCPVGCLIRDDEYKPSYEGQNLRSLLNKSLPDSLKNRLESHKFLLTDFQEVHDACTMCTNEIHRKKLVAEWEYEFKNIARKRGLDYETIST